MKEIEVDGWISIIPDKLFNKLFNDKKISKRRTGARLYTNGNAISYKFSAKDMDLLNVSLKKFYDETFIKLEEILGENGFEYVGYNKKPHRGKIAIVDIKEKFGQFRFYVSGYNDKQSKLCDGLEEELSKKFDISIMIG